MASHSAPNQPASVRIARCPKDITGKWNWQRLQLGTDPLPDVVQQTLSGMRFSTMKVRPGVPGSHPLHTPFIQSQLLLDLIHAYIWARVVLLPAKCSPTSTD